MELQKISSAAVKYGMTNFNEEPNQINKEFMESMSYLNNIFFLVWMAVMFRACSYKMCNKENKEDDDDDNGKVQRCWGEFLQQLNVSATVVCFVH